MICKHCSQVIEKRGDNYVVIKFEHSAWEEWGEKCITVVEKRGGYHIHQYKHEPSKNSIVKDIIEDL